MPFECRAETLSFVGSAPAVFVNEAELPAPPSRVFEVLADVASWPRWFDDMRASGWLPGHSGGLGAQRRMELGALTAVETMLAWEPGARFSFRIDSVSLPLVRAMVEDFQLAALPDGRTQLNWRVYYELKPWARLIHPLLRFIFGRQFKRTLAGLQRYLA